MPSPWKLGDEGIPEHSRASGAHDGAPTPSNPHGSAKPPEDWRANPLCPMSTTCEAVGTCLYRHQACLAGARGIDQSPQAEGRP